MADNDVAIKVEGLSKYYKLGVINNGTLFRDMQSWWARVRGKDDPHAKIGSKYDPTKEGFWALKDLNFEIKKGDRVGIIGHNGAGKSTLLKLLSQITAPTEGSIKINGKIASLLEVGTGFHPEMTGRENIYMNGAILGMSHDEIDKKVNDIIEFSEIGEHIDTPVKRYSSGMYVRLAFAVAAHLDSDILIADEVLAVGDAAFQKKALGKMNELSTGEGRTVLFVSHNMAQVKNLCNVGMVLEKGEIKYNGNLNDAIDVYFTNKNRKNETSNYSFSENDKDFQILNIDFLDKNLVPSCTFESQEEINIDITVVSRKPILNMYGYFGVNDSFHRSEIVFDETEVENVSFSSLKVGMHKYRMTIRGGILPVGTHYFVINFQSPHYEGFFIEQHIEDFSFKVIDTLTSRKDQRNALTSYIPRLRELI